ncbi:MAG: porin family protein [Bacteroidales bacterium]|nr:porin family protein [Bacteroidales bacterium]MBK7172583.1 porin family protein [Bacteroidales bacterium]
MKKLSILFLIVLFSSSALMAQFEKGNCFTAGYSNLGLDIGNKKSKSGGTSVDVFKYSEFFINPEAGYFIADNLMTGLFIDFYTEHYKYESGSDDKYFKFLVGPVVRYYFFQLNKMNLYGEGSLGTGFDKSTYKYTGGTEDETKSTYFSARVGGGFTYLMTDNFGLDLFVGYDYDSWFTKNEEEVDQKSAASVEKTKDSWSSFEINMGLVYIFQN